MEPIDLSVKLDLEPQLEMSSREINARNHLDKNTQNKSKLDEITRLENRTKLELGFAEQEKMKELERLTRTGNYTYTEKGQILPTKPCNAENLTNLTAVNFSTKEAPPEKNSKVVVKLTVAQRTNRL